MNYLRGRVDQYPLDLMAEALLRYAKPETAQSMLDSYDAFLTRLDDPEVRKHLDGLRPEAAEADTVFQEMQGHCRSFQGALQALFFMDHPALAALNQEYGVF